MALNYGVVMTHTLIVFLILITTCTLSDRSFQAAEATLLAFWLSTL